MRKMLLTCSRRQLSRRNAVDFALAAALSLASLMSGCGGGGKSVTQQTPAPSNLTYPQSSLKIIAGVAVQTSAPTVTGSVTSFSVSPSLPGGLSLNASTGAITGITWVISAATPYTITASNSSGSTTATLQITVLIPPPSNLTYTTNAISSFVGNALPIDSPSYTGTVTGFSVSPALPAGLVLDPIGGTIYGTPTVASPTATYTVSALNSTGSATAALQIAVIGPPSNLTYAQPSITGSVFAAIQADTPTVNGPVAGYTVTPNLPAGLNLDATAGTISGTPVQGVSQTPYTVTATNPAGATTTQVMIAINQASSALLELGHGTQVAALRTVGNRVLSVDTSGHWNLWDYATAKIVASGDGSNQQIALTGTVAAVSSTNTIQILSPADGSVLGSVPNAAWWQLAPDGSYLVTGSTTALTIWSTSGVQDAARGGDYHAVNAVSLPGKVLVALGPAGNSVIETITAPGGASTVSPAFLGVFYAWFTDGNRFLTTLSNTVRTYSNAAVQEAQVTLPSLFNLTGQGDWIWTTADSGSNNLFPMYIYAIGASTPSYTFQIPLDASLTPSGNFLGALGTAQMNVIDFSGTTPTNTTYTPPSGLSGNAFAASSSTQWLGGAQTGAIFDGNSLLSTPRFFGFGMIEGLAAVPGFVALSTSNGQILLLKPDGTTYAGPIRLWAGELALSSDGTVLAADTGWASNASPDEIRFYSLPTLKVIASFPFTYPDLAAFTLSGSGTIVGIQDNLGFGPRYVTDLTGKVLWTDSGINAPIYLSPDGTLIAAPDEMITSQSCTPLPTTSLYKNGTLVTTLSAAYGEGWIDNNHLLASNWTPGFKCLSWAYAGSTIYDATGAVVTTIPTPSALPGLAAATFPTANTVYDPAGNTIYSLTSGATLWQAPPEAVNPTGGGAVFGPYVVSQVGHQVVLYTY